ncbi:hypothetical protein [Burkholderia gladioli]|uniref:hypothetical protein n=1 Tax=Burkholderia gladioli TaxID=28095 RepID=UPI002FE2CD84
MHALTQTVHFDDEGTLQDVLIAAHAGAQSTNDNLKRLIDAGTAVTVLVPGMPARALLRKSAIEKLTGQSLPGSDLIALPFA